jgi:putative N6-adenine-specific DNA methylase
MTPTPLTPRGLQRRIAHHLTSQPQRFFAICGVGFEPFLQRELSALPGVQIDEATSGGVEFSGPFDLIYQANVQLRTAVRVLMRVEQFIARSYPELFNKASRIGWERYVGLAPAVAIEVSARSSVLHHTDNIARAVGDAIVKRMEAQGCSVTLDPAAALRLFVRFADDHCTLSMDSSGEPLYKRGYRQESARAPLRESTAAALLMAADAASAPCIVDPFCGSGTFVLEAALAASATPAGAQRSFAFEKWPSFGSATWNYLRRSSAPQGPAQLDKPRFFGCDSDERMVSASQSNGRSAGVAESVQFTLQDARTITPPQFGTTPGLIITNPPYGKRLGQLPTADALVRSFAQALRNSFSGWRFGIVLPCGMESTLRGLKIERTVAFCNGGIDVNFILGRVEG